MERRRKTLEELNLLDNFLFNTMLTYPDTGEAFIRKLLETLFDRKFPHLKIHPQKTFIGLNTGLRGARLDVYIEEDGSVQIHDEAIPTVYDVEPDHNKDAAQIKAFPKRARFYHISWMFRTKEPYQRFIQSLIGFFSSGIFLYFSSYQTAAAAAGQCPPSWYWFWAARTDKRYW